MFFQFWMLTQRIEIMVIIAVISHCILSYALRMLHTVYANCPFQDIWVCAEFWSVSSSFFFFFFLISAEPFLSASPSSDISALLVHSYSLLKIHKKHLQNFLEALHICRFLFYIFPVWVTCNSRNQKWGRPTELLHCPRLGLNFVMYV